MITMRTVANIFMFSFLICILLAVVGAMAQTRLSWFMPIVVCFGLWIYSKSLEK
jgi:hypothetical protein